MYHPLQRSHANIVAGRIASDGGVVIGLSAVFMVMDLALIAKTCTVYDLNKSKKGTELANKLRQAADDRKYGKETETLRPLALFW